MMRTARLEARACMYLARGEDEAMVSVMPEKNMLIYNNKDNLKFVKYVNFRMEHSFHDLFITYYE